MKLHAMSKLGLIRSGRLEDVRPGDPLAAALPIGAAVYAVGSRLWITQEGLYEDIILNSGEHFDIERPGLVVISSIDGVSTAYFAVSPEARGANGFPAGFYDAVIARAKELRHRELEKLVSAATEYIVRFARWISSCVRAAFPKPRAPRLHRP
jgi:hypothetical protein